jgi:acetate kinase
MEHWMKPAFDPTVVLALNSGSSSLKLALYSFYKNAASNLASGAAEEIGSNVGRVWLRRSSELLLDESRRFAGAAEAAEYLVSALLGTSLPSPQVIGHRMVHGGPGLREHQLITPEVLRQLEAAIIFAPLHLPPALDVLRRAMNDFPDVPQIACFDTAFHRTIPEHAARLPFARGFWERGLRRYGFHGLSCESIVHTLGDQLPERTVIAHLGNGCSVTAVRNGASVETTMGLTPIGGVMMGTRSGDLDPGVLLHLLQVERYAPERLEELLNHSSGLLGVSGVSSDMRQLLEASRDDLQARTAIDMFCYQVRKSIGSMAAVLGGLDLLVFAGGIGENAASVRANICSGLDYLGILLEPAANQRNDSKIGSGLGTCIVRIVESDEDVQIARHSHRLATDSRHGG